MNRPRLAKLAIYVFIGVLLVMSLGLPWKSAAASASATGGYEAAKLFNQANADARDGNTGLAVLNYERARLLAVNDADIALNLHVLRDKNHLPQPATSSLAKMFGFADPATFAWLGCAGLLLAGLGLMLLLSTEKRPVLSGAALVGGLLLVSFEAGNAALLWPQMNAAIVTQNALPARLSPVSVGEPRFTLREGEMVEIRTHHQGFLLVRNGAGDLGWVQDAGIEALVPREPVQE